MPTRKFDRDSDVFKAHRAFVRRRFVAKFHLVMHSGDADCILRKQACFAIAPDAQGAVPEIENDIVGPDFLLE